MSEDNKLSRRKFILATTAAVAGGLALAAKFDENIGVVQDTQRKKLDTLDTVTIEYGTFELNAGGEIPNTYRFPTALTKLSKEELGNPKKVAQAFGRNLDEDTLKDDSTILGSYEYLTNPPHDMVSITVGELKNADRVNDLYDTFTKGKVIAEHKAVQTGLVKG